MQHKAGMKYLQDRSARQVQKTIEAISNVTDAQLEKRLLDIAKLQAVLPVLSRECTFYNTAYCRVTGAPLGGKIYSDEMLQSMATIHGSARMIELLKQSALCQISPNVVYSDPESLHNLSIKAPLEYFMMCAGKLHVYACELQLHRIQEKWTSEDRLKILKDKITAYAKLQSLSDADLPIVIKCNELMRRFLGLHHPEEAKIKLMQMEASLAVVCSSVETLGEFYRYLQSLLAHILRDFTTNRRISTGLVAQMKADKRGSTAFYTQRKLKALTKDEAAVEDLLGFFKETSEITIKSLARNCEPVKAKVVTSNSPFKLAISKREPQAQAKPAKPSANNPFALAFKKREGTSQ